MWKQGTIEVNGKQYEYCIKQYDEGSEFGINGGRISKLNIRVNGKEVANYDRGWDIEPKKGDAKLALDLILHNENY